MTGWEQNPLHPTAQQRHEHCSSTEHRQLLLDLVRDRRAACLRMAVGTVVLLFYYLIATVLHLVLDVLSDAPSGAPYDLVIPLAIVAGPLCVFLGAAFYRKRPYAPNLKPVSTLACNHGHTGRVIQNKETALSTISLFWVSLSCLLCAYVLVRLRLDLEFSVGFLAVLQTLALVGGLWFTVWEHRQFTRACDQAEAMLAVDGPGTAPR